MEFASSIQLISRLKADESNVFWETTGSLWMSGADAFDPQIISDDVLSWSLHGGAVFYATPDEPGSCCGDFEAGSVVKYDTNTAAKSVLFKGTVGAKLFSAIVADETGLFLARGGTKSCAAQQASAEILWIQPDGSSAKVFSDYTSHYADYGDETMLGHGKKFLFARSSVNLSCSPSQFGASPSVSRFVVGGTPVTMASAGYSAPVALKDVVSVGGYDWILGSNLVFRVNAEGDFKVKSSSLSNVRSIAADGYFLYFIDTSKAAIMRLAP